VLLERGEISLEAFALYTAMAERAFVDPGQNRMPLGRRPFRTIAAAVRWL
jgi:hypothetical protein